MNSSSTRRFNGVTQRTRNVKGVALARFATVTLIVLVALILHELHIEALFPSFPILATEVGWWLVGLFLLAYVKIVERKSLSSLGIRAASKSTAITAIIGFGLALLGVAFLA